MRKIQIELPEDVPIFYLHQISALTGIPEIVFKDLIDKGVIEKSPGLAEFFTPLQLSQALTASRLLKVGISIEKIVDNAHKGVSLDQTASLLVERETLRRAAEKALSRQETEYSRQLKRFLRVAKNRPRDKGNKT